MFGKSSNYCKVSQKGCSNNNSINTKQPNSNNSNSETNQLSTEKINQTNSKTSFIKRLIPFSKSKTQHVKLNNSECGKLDNSTKIDKEYTGVKVLKQFWNEQISLTSAKSTENLENKQKSATLRNFSQSNDSLFCEFENDCSRKGKSFTIDNRLPLDEFNKFKNADFIRNKRQRLSEIPVPVNNDSSIDFNKGVRSISNQNRLSHVESVALNAECSFPQISATDGKIHWIKRDEFFAKKSSPTEINMYVKSNNIINQIENSRDCESKYKTAIHESGSESPEKTKSQTSSVSSNLSLSTNTSRKFSFKTISASTAFHTNKKTAVASNGNKVAQLAQRFNQLIQQDVTILEEVKKRGIFVHRSGGHIYKIREDKVEQKCSISRKKSTDDTATDDITTNIVNSGKNSSRKKNALKKRPSIRVLIETPRKDGKGGNVVSKTRLYETNIIKKDTIIVKPKVPDKSERVLAKTKELTNKKSNTDSTIELVVENNDTTHENNLEVMHATPKIDSVHVMANEQDYSVIYDDKNLNINELEKVKGPKSKYRQIYDKISFRPSFLYGKKSNKTMMQEKEVDYPEPIKHALSYTEVNVVAEKMNVKEEMETEAEELPIQPMDLYLNIFFNNENLSKSANDVSVVDKNVNSQGQISIDADDVTTQQADVKPNESFLFRTYSKTKFFSTCDIFVDDNESTPETTLNVDANSFEVLGSFESIVLEQNDIKLDSVDYECNGTKDYTYEIISKPKEMPIETKLDRITNETNDKLDNSQEENIYQSLCEVKKDSASVKSYDSFENYDEIAQSFLNSNSNVAMVPKEIDDDYIVCEPEPPEPPPPRKTDVVISSPVLTSTTSSAKVQDLPELPVPKRNIQTTNYELNKCGSNLSTTYEKIKYDQLPLKLMSKSTNLQNKELPLPPRNSTTTTTTPSSTPSSKNKDFDQGNIYDTIRNADNRYCYESISNSKKSSNNQPESTLDSDDSNPYRHSTNDTMSIISNCYESISLKQNYSTINQILRHAISTTTLSSEHRINSIYGTTVGQSLTPPSDRSGSDNSDEWIDLSDEEIEHESPSDKKFIVVCEKANKSHHRSPDWSRKVRDHRLHQQLLSEWDDDSDHHYESLYSIQQQRLALEQQHEELPKPLQQLSSQSNTTNSISSKAKHQVQDKCRDNDDEYDSFESDNDFLDQADEFKGRSDNVIDITNSELPELPQATGQVYAFVQKIKNFGSLSKSEISKGLSKIAKTKITPNKKSSTSPRSQFYESTQITDDNTYVSSTFDSKSLSKKSRGFSKLSKLGRMTINKVPNNFNLNDPYASITDYQSSVSATKQNKNESSPTLSQSMSNFSSLINNSANDDDATAASLQQSHKSKDGKSFKSKFRKGSAPNMSSSSASTSNIYGSLSSKTSTFYVTDSVDVDSGIFAVSEKSTSDNSTINTTTSPIHPGNDIKRRSIALVNTSRPNNPPPPPPLYGQTAISPTTNGSEKKIQKASRKYGTTTSWYAECGLFKPDSIQDEENVKNDKSEKTATSSWYADTGLYQTSGNSVASSSGSSGVSTGGECSPCDDNSHSMFLNEPLYQLYTAAKLESISSGDFEAETEAETDGYEEVGKKLIEQTVEKPSRPSALQLIGPNQGPSRTLWSEVPEVIQSEIFLTLSQNEQRLQEAKFEILTSEASYLKSLSLLRSHFMNHPAFRDQQHLDAQDRKALFSFIIPVQECSDRLLCDLESCWQDSIMLLGLSKSIYKHAEKYFHVYISYCEHQGRLDRTLKRLKENNVSFKESLDHLENDSILCGLNLHSFLMLPMQRITRLPLLIDAVMTKLKSDDEEFESWKMTLAILNKIVFQCNQAANRCEQAFEMEALSKQIEFPINITPFSLVPVGIAPNTRQPRCLVRRGELTQFVWRSDDAKLTFGKKFTKNNLYCFLFTDLLVLTKKKGEESFLVFDYCQRSLLQLSSGDVIPQLPTKEMMSGKHLILMSLLENCAGKPIDLILSCPSETERQRWLQATEPPTSDNPDETLYEQWDCPQVVMKHSYQALEPDELNLDLGDVVNVSRKMVDGWYYGERIRDGAQGWFPGNYAEEVHSAHVRARNLKQRHRLLLYTANYLESQKDTNSKKK